MNIVIIDDEKIAIDVLTIMLNKLEQFSVSIKGTFINAKDAFPFLDKESIDIVFLDMEMIELHGLNVAQYLLENYPSIQVIFVTAHSQFAVDAFEVNAVDYLLKPVHEKRLVKALKKAEQSIINSTKLKKYEPIKNTFHVHTLGSFQLLNPNQEVVKWRTRKVQELFLYLWINKYRPMLISVIKEELWPEMDQEKSSSHLHTAIYHLRKIFKHPGVEQPIKLVNNHYQLKVELTSDYGELNSILEQERHDETSIRQILHLYKGDFLSEEGYQWAIQLNHHLKQRVLHALENYTQSQSAKAQDQLLLKLSCLQKMLDLDEYNEEYMYNLLIFFIEQNKKSDVIKFYQIVKQRLEDELGVIVPKRIQQEYQSYLQ
ncbi:response regulator receiver protein [Bacillaceae bacterium SAOS 7]|nr:response regulator receiver protein [Bacillaceae bacterium SAOS 7]